jgi:response regulator of citrate/malate metabolism
VIDILMPECDGIEQITWLSAQKCHPRVFLVSGGDPFYLTMTKSIGEALGQLCITVIEKPLDIIVFRNHLKAVQAAYRIHSPVLTGGHD